MVTKNHSSGERSEYLFYFRTGILELSFVYTYLIIVTEPLSSLLLPLNVKLAAHT